MGKEERVYELSYIESYEYVARKGDLLTCYAMGSLMKKKLKASDEKGEFVLGEDQGRIRKVHFLNPELNTEEMREVIKPWDFNHGEEDEKIYSYEEFISLGKPKKIRIIICTDVLETLEEVVQV